MQLCETRGMRALTPFAPFSLMPSFYNFIPAFWNTSYLLNLVDFFSSIFILPIYTPDRIATSILIDLLLAEERAFHGGCWIKNF